MSEQGNPQERRQYSQFRFFSMTPEWRGLEEAKKSAIRREVVSWANSVDSELIVRTYSTFGLKAECDFLIWRIGYSLEKFQQMSSALFRSSLGQYLRSAYSFLSMTKRSIYVDKHLHEGQEGRRLILDPGKGKYLFVYPFVKTREWYLLPQEKRQEMMDDHIRIGHQYPSVKLHTTYSFGLDDQEFVVAFETDEPADFLDLVMELRSSQGSRYTLKDTPIFTCVKKSIEEILSM